MKARWACFVVVAFLLVVTATAAAQQGSPESATPVADSACAFPDELRSEMLLEAAVEQYGILLEATPDLLCAQQGFIAASRGLMLASTSTPPPTPTPTATPEPFGAAEGLDNAGFEEKAEEAYVQAITDHPETTPPASLDHLDGKWWNDGLWSGIGGFLASFSSRITEVSDWLLSLGGLAIALLLLFGAFKYWKSGTSRTSLDIVPFDAGASGAEIGTALAESVQSSYTRITNGRVESTTKLVADAAAENETAIPADLAKGPSGAALAIYNWVQKRKSKAYVFRGTMIGDPARGAGIVVSLERDNRVCDSETIWFKDYLGAKSTDAKDTGPAVQDYLALAETVAIWLFARMAKHEPAPAKVNPHIGHPQTAPSHYHMTWEKWDSYALFRNSLTTYAWGDTSTAIALLSKSLSKDPDFLPARMNLGTLQMQASAGDKELSRATLTKVYEQYLALLDDLWGRGGLSRSADTTIRPKLLFNYLAAIDYGAGWENPKFHKDTAVLVKDLDTLVETAKQSHDPDLREMVVPLKLLLDTLIVRQGSDDERTTVLEQYQDRFDDPVKATKVFGHRAFYGNACFCAAAFHHASADKDMWAERSLEHLRTAIRMEPRHKNWAPLDPSLEPLRVSDDHLPAFSKIVGPDQSEEEKNPEEETDATRTEHVILFEDQPTRIEHVIVLEDHPKNASLSRTLFAIAKRLLGEGPTPDKQ